MEIQHLDGLGWPGASVTDHLQVTLCMYWYKGLGANPSGFCFWSVDFGLNDSPDGTATVSLGVRYLDGRKIRKRMHPMDIYELMSAGKRGLLGSFQNQQGK